MEAQRLPWAKKEFSQRIFLSNKDYDFVKDLNMDNKGILNFNSIVSREKVVDDDIFKSIDIKSLSQDKTMTARIL